MNTDTNYIARDITIYCGAQFKLTTGHFQVH